MERSEHLKFCKVCTNQKFDANKGIVCGLTDDVADFEVNCDNYIADEQILAQEKEKQIIAENTFEGRAKARAEKWNAKSEKLKSQIDPEKVIKGGASWFYWIAALSLINSITILTETDFGFIVGLGITQLLDGVMLEIIGEYNIWSLIPTIFFSGLFVIFGYNANKFNKSAFIAGMIIYGLDTLIFFLVDDYLSIGFHVFALVMIFKGYKSLKELKSSESI